MDKTPRMNHKPGNQDTFQTPPHALEPLLRYLDSSMYLDYADTHEHGGHAMIRQTIIWESAAGKEQLLAHSLIDEGFAVIATDIQYDPDLDFFTFSPNERWDIQITNPPFSLKYKWLERSFELGKPFALLVPSYTIVAGTFAELFQRYNENPWAVEVVSPTRRINFKTPHRGWANSSAQMHTCWITWGLNIAASKRDALSIYYTELRDAKYDENNSEIT